MIQLEESLATPMINPKIEVRITPKKEMINVLSSPTLKTSQCVLDAVKGMGVSVISKPDAELRKSNPDLMPLASMLCAVFPATYMIKITKPMMVINWYRIPLTFSFLKNDTWQPFEVYVEIKIQKEFLAIDKYRRESPAIAQMIVAYYLNGGEYMIPPFDQSAFTPLSILSGVFLPTFASNISA